MKYTTGSYGRVFIVRFEHEDDFLEKIVELAEKEKIFFATVTLIGALARADLVAGPKELQLPAVPSWESFDDGREVLGFGTIIKGEDKIYPHIHAVSGKGKEVLMGCFRKDCKTFITIEAVVTEVVGVDISKKRDNSVGCDLMSFE